MCSPGSWPGLRRSSSGCSGPGASSASRCAGSPWRRSASPWCRSWRSRSTSPAGPRPWCSSSPCIWAYLAVPVATGFAVLRYRLYDVDRVIGGAVVWTVLVVVASAGYLVAVAAVGRAVEDRGRPSWLALVAFVVVVLALQPVRRAAGPGERTGSSTGPGPPATRCSSRNSEHLADAVWGRAFLTGVAETTARLLACHLLSCRRPAGRRQRGERGLAAPVAPEHGPGALGGSGPARGVRTSGGWCSTSRRRPRRPRRARRVLREFCEQAGPAFRTTDEESGGPCAPG